MSKSGRHRQVLWMWSNATSLCEKPPGTGPAQKGTPTYPPRIPKLLSESVDNQMRFENEAVVCDNRRGTRNEWQQDTGRVDPEVRR